MNEETLYEDSVAIAKLHPTPAVKGHIIIQPKRPVKHLSQLSHEESAHLFTVASYTAAILFQGLQAEGTNIICNEDEELLTIHVIVRRQDDNLNFSWTGKEMSPSVMNDALERLRDAIDTPVESEKDAPAAPLEKAKSAAPKSSANAEIKEAEERENELIKQLIRIP